MKPLYCFYNVFTLCISTAMHEIQTNCTDFISLNSHLCFVLSSTLKANFNYEAESKIFLIMDDYETVCVKE